MSRSVHVTITPIEQTHEEELYSLRRWLVEEDELRGRIRVIERPPDPGRLGSLPEALVIALGPGGAGTILASAVIAWIRHRSGDISLKVTRADGGTMELRGRRLRGLAAVDVSTLVNQLDGLLRQQPGEMPDAHAAESPGE